MRNKEALQARVKRIGKVIFKLLREQAKIEM